VTPDEVPSFDPAAPPTPERASAGSVLIGVVALAGERMHIIGDRQAPTAALVVGLMSDGRDAFAQRVTGWARGARDAVPVEKVRGALDHAKSRGRVTLDSSKADASRWLHSTSQAPMKWAEDTAIPKVMDDMTPYMTEQFMPKIIDAMMPHIREQVVPAIIDDLTTDPRIRTLIAEQSAGVVSAAAGELRQVTSSADDKVENAFQRTFSRNHTS
jgi:hypothetical protein